jgi:hypothetical protein
MLKTLMITAAVSGLVISGSFAQSTNEKSAGNGPKFIAMQSPDQWVFSKFKGTDVIGPSDETIGGVNDLLFDKSGKIVAVIVGVGGFLGIGQKNVAIDMGGFQVAPASSATTNGATDPTNVKLKVAWTKDELKQASDFQYFKPPSGAASNDSGPGTIGQRSIPMAPAPAKQ